jgi:lysyl-tRNA synthetase, class I
LLFKRIAGTRHVGLDDVPTLMDEYDYYEDVYFGKVTEDNTAKITKIKGIYEFINKLQSPKEPDIHIPYRFIVQQASIFPPDDDSRVEKVFNRLLKYGMVKGKSAEGIKHKIRLASNWADDNNAKSDEKFEVQLSDLHIKSLQELIKAMKPFTGLSDSPENAKIVQSTVFSIARANGIEPKEFFTLLYRMFLNSDEGPRMGNYILDLGIDKATSMLKRYIQG